MHATYFYMIRLDGRDGLSESNFSDIFFIKNTMKDIVSIRTSVQVLCRKIKPEEDVPQL